MASQEDLILSLVQGEDGREWASHRVGWKKSNIDKACDWEGIECDKNDAVISIVASNADLSATIPSELGKLTSLKRIILEKNMLYGPIPPEFAKLNNLEEVDFMENNLTGSLPTSFASKKLKILNLGLNRLTGTIPPTFVSPDSIEEIKLLENNFSGTIPSAITRMSKLNTLSLSNNFLYGSIPKNIGDLLLLEYLYLDNNDLVGFIPSSLARPKRINGKAGNMLKEIWLHDNSLSGTIPVVLSELDQLTDFFVDGNKLTGTVPKDLCSAEINVDFFDKLDADIDRNYCDSIACPTNSAAFEGVYPCKPCNNPHYNPYLGHTGECVNLNQRKILNQFYKSTNLGTDGWNGEDNWNDDNVFICNYSGVTCDVNNNVVEISLKGRGLKGAIPGEIGFLEYLQVFDVSDNELSGFLPVDLKWAPLVSLDISGNNMKGIIPPSLCLQVGVNGNGNGGDYNCEHIACPAGTYSESGRKIENYDECKPCDPESSFNIGAKSCPLLSYKVKYGGVGVSAIIIVSITLVMFCIGGAFFAAIRIHEERKQREKLNEQNNFSVEDDGMEEYISSARLSHNMHGVASLSYADVPERSIRQGVKPVRRKYDQLRRNMPPPDDPLYKGTFPDMEDTHSVMSGSSRSSNSKSEGKGVELTPFVNGGSTEGGVRSPSGRGNSAELHLAVRRRPSVTEVWDYPDPLEKSTNEDRMLKGNSTKEDWLDVPKI